LMLLWCRHFRDPEPNSQSDLRTKISVCGKTTAVWFTLHKRLARVAAPELLRVRASEPQHAINVDHDPTRFQTVNTFVSAIKQSTSTFQRRQDHNA
jgi:hypothetical protein